MLSLLPVLLAAAFTPGRTCPTDQEIAAELSRLGALTAVAELGSAEVTVQESVLNIVMRDLQGLVLGRRAVDAPPGCEARAAVAAVLIAAWAGDWARAQMMPGKRSAPAFPVLAPPMTDASAPALTPLAAIPDAPAGVPSTPSPPAASEMAPASSPPTAREPAATVEAPTSPASPVSATPEPVVEAPAAAPAPPVQAVSRGFLDPAIDAALMASGLHDGDAMAWGLGGQVAARGRRYSLLALVESIGDRERALGAGRAHYGVLRLGLGAGVRWEGTRAFIEMALVPELARHVLQGKDLSPTHQVVAWGPLADVRVSAGLRLGRWASFLYLGASYSLLRERLVLDNAPESITLSRWNVAAGLGMSFGLRNPVRR